MPNLETTPIVLPPAIQEKVADLFRATSQSPNPELDINVNTMVITGYKELIDHNNQIMITLGELLNIPPQKVTVLDYLNYYRQQNL